MQQRQLAAIAAGLVMLLIAGADGALRAPTRTIRASTVCSNVCSTPRTRPRPRWSSSRSGRSGSNPTMPRINRLMQQGVVAMSEQDYAAALQTFTRMVEQAPEFAEGWNKRATVYYLMGNWRASVRDIQRTLALEPRHFGALFGLGLIYEELDQPEAALRSFEATLVLNPHSESTRQMIEQLRQQLRGSPT